MGAARNMQQEVKMDTEILCPYGVGADSRLATGDKCRESYN